MSSEARQRVLMVGFEAVEPSLVEKWCDEGLLPNMQKLREEGIFRIMRGPAEVSSGATWSSVNCGVTPGKHGMGFCHRQYLNGTYEVRKKKADEVGREPFWLHLSDAGYRSLTLDVPETKTYGVKGTTIVGWGLEYNAWPACSEPAEVLPAIVRKYGKHPLDGWYQSKPSTLDGWRELIATVNGATATRTQVVKELLTTTEWDFAFPVYAESHFAGHLFWHIGDPEHPEYDPALARELGNPILQNYQLCDAAIGEFREIAPDATLFVVSNTGMGPNYSARHFVGEILDRLELRTKNASARPGKAKKLLQYVLPSADVYGVERFEKILGTAGIMRIKRLVPEKLWDTWSRRFLLAGNDWRNSIAYDIPGDNTGTIRINLKGREPNGVVDPSEYHELIDKIEQQFLQIIDEETGQPVVTEVVRVREKYKGDEHVEDLPDVLIKWREGKPIRRMYSQSIGTIERDHLPDKRTGAHKDHGFIMATGPGIRHAQVEELVYNWDIAPTILSLFGLPIPEDMDGQPMLDMVVPASGAVAHG